MPRIVLVLAGGAAPSPHVRRALPASAMCIAADSGVDHARQLGLVPDLVVGDLDSASPDAVAWAGDRGAAIERLRPDKDETDLEMALRRAVEQEPDRVVVAAIGGGRFDHLLANVAVLSDTRYAAVEVDALVGTASLSIIHRRRALTGRRDELVSLLPMHGDAHGVTTSGLGYPLADETLRSGASRGVSNYFVAEQAEVTVADGVLLAVQPDRLHDTERVTPSDGEHGGNDME